MYRPALAAQIAAYLIIKEGGSINCLKLTKLLYFVDRTYLLKYGSLLTGDTYAALPNGPVLSQTLDATRFGLVPEWNALIADAGNYTVALADPSLSLEHLDLLSVASEEVINEVYAKYGHLNNWEIRNLTHTPKECPEWHNPGSSSIPISYQDVLKLHGKTDAEISSTIQAIKEQEAYVEFLSQMV